MAVKAVYRNKNLPPRRAGDSTPYGQLKFYVWLRTLFIIDTIYGFQVVQSRVVALG